MPGAVLLVLVLLCLAPHRAFPQEDAYPQQLVQAAAAQHLHRERTWNILLHYVETISGGHESRIDDENFFLAPRGKTDPAAELAATIQSFFVPPSKDNDHAACRFPARFNWLKSRLDLDPARLPPFACSAREKMLQTVEAKSAALVFPVGHINSPASMFGHTLIRIDGSSRSNLVSYAVNYAAEATDTNGVIYAWKGLTGGYHGYYSFLPYYLKVKEYGHMEHRDMWEYRLKLSEEEVGRMLDHVWELQNISSQYFFLDENCSFNLLYLMEAARPELRLTENTRFPVLPTDTITIALANGLVEEAVFRPSQGVKIRKILSLLDGDTQLAALRLAQPGSDPGSVAESALSPEERIRVLDLAAEVLQFRYGRRELEKDVFNRQYLKLLGARSRLGTLADDQYRVEPPSSPEKGHGTVRLSVGGGIRKGKPFGELALRPAFHGLMDPDQGYLQGAQIEFLNTVVRYGGRRETLTLHSLHLVNIMSVTPRDAFFKPLSWKVVGGVDTEPLKDGRDHHIFRLNSGGGLAYSSPSGGIVYGMAEVDANAGRSIPGTATIGIGASFGVLQQVNEWWKIHLSSRGLLYGIGDSRTAVTLGAEQLFRLNRNNSLETRYAARFVNRHQIHEAGIGWHRYF